MIWNELEDLRRRENLKRGYVEVKTPLLYDVADLRHLGALRELPRQHVLHALARRASGEFALKPMNCPGHMLLFGSRLRSYRDLPYPLRGVVDAAPRRARRDAPRAPAREAHHAGRRAHLLSAPTRSRTRSSAASTTPRSSTTCSGWRRASSSRRARRRSSAPTRSGTSPRARCAPRSSGAASTTIVNEGDGAFYGPKIDLHMTDVLGRSWQMGTIQLDSQMPQHFGLTYMGADNAEHTPYVVHRALLGSLERFMGILIEHYGGAFPFWLAPVQVRVLPVGESHLDAGARRSPRACAMPATASRSTSRRDDRQADPRRRAREDPVHGRLRRQGERRQPRGPRARRRAVDAFPGRASRQAPTLLPSEA